MSKGCVLFSARPRKSVNFLYFCAIAAFVLACSQAAGWWVNFNIPVNGTVEWNGFIHFTHIRNYGGVFGLLQGQGWLFGLLSIGLLGGIVVWLYLGTGVSRFEFCCFGFIAGGGLSNVIDRQIHGGVIDYVNLQHIPYWNYIFNLADVMIHVGIWPMILYGLLARKPGRYSHS